MTAKSTSNFWWLKKSKTDSNLAKPNESGPDISPAHDGRLTPSLAEFWEKEREIDFGAGGDQGDVDIGTILDEINRIAAQSPLGPFEKIQDDRSVEELMKEAEKIYNESSKSFEQLSQHSATSHNVSEELNTESSMSTPAQSPVHLIAAEMEVVHNVETPTPKSICSPIENMQGSKDNKEQNADDYSDDFSENNKSDVSHNPSTVSNSDIESVSSVPSLVSPTSPKEDITNISKTAVIIPNTAAETYNLGMVTADENKDLTSVVHERVEGEEEKNNERIKEQRINDIEEKLKEQIEQFRGDVLKKDNIIEHLIEENKHLKEDMRELQNQLEETITLLEQAKNALKAQTMKSPEVNLELEKALEEIKDTKEVNTALQMQLDSVNNSYQLLKIANDELQSTNKTWERKFSELEANLTRYKNDLFAVRQQRDKSQENETNLNKLLEIEKLQVKSLKLQTEKDARCIMDLNRQIKEMERIIARKHPDSVSALIVAAKNDASETNLTTKRFLEDRIKVLEVEAQKRDAQNSKVFIDVQEKFNQMKVKYESHIEDLELHVNDLKNQLKHRPDTFDVYTQTQMYEDLGFPVKEAVNVAIQTDAAIPPQKNVVQRVGCVKKMEKIIDNKEETHLLATIRGLQTDLSNKEKVIAKLQREMEDLRKTNRRLQKEREGSLRNLSERREFRSYPDKLAHQLKQDPSNADMNEKTLEEELRAIKSERDKMKLQLCRMEEDYQKLKSKRIQDLNTLQEAHEKEVSTYLTNITPLREQLEIQQISLSSMQKQLSTVKEELAIVTVERDHLNSRLQYSAILPFEKSDNDIDESDVKALQKKISHLERRYEEREHRLRAIVHGLAQKNLSNMTCEQCAARQQQLIGYKAELDQLIATLKSLQ